MDPRGPYLSQLIKRFFPTDKAARILDLGCGHGALLYFCRRAGYQNLAGVDTSEEQTRLARTLGLDFVVHGDLFDYLRNARDKEYDVVIAFDVLEHFGREELLDFFQQVERILKPGGRFIVHVPNGESPFVGAILYGDFTHELAFTRRSISQIATAMGFVRADCYEDRPIRHGGLSLLRWALWLFMRTILFAVVAIETGEYRGWVFSRNLLAVITKKRS